MYNRDKGGGYDPRGGGRYGNLQPYDYANWGYIILYLIVILGSVLGNGFFLWTIKKNVNLRKTPHFMIASLAIRDLIVTLSVVPFVIDSQAVNMMEWKAGDVMCKFFAFLNYGMMATHAFTLVFLLLFLYFWYRKQESYMTEDGQTIVRKTKMHKWAIPLAWVIGLGLAIPAGALATQSSNPNTGVQTCAVWNGRTGSEDSGYKVAVSTVFAGFILPLVLLVFPFIALLMQLCGGREPRLDPPHNRLAATGIGLIVIFAATRAPFEVYELMKLFHQSSFGFKGNSLWGTPYAAWTFDTDIILNCLIYVACLLNPILYFALNPDYRTGFVQVWRTMCCKKDSSPRQPVETKPNDRPYPSRGGRQAPIIKQNSKQDPLVSRRQPQIIPSHKKHHQQQQQQFYPNQPQHLHQPLLQQNYIQPNQILFPEHHLQQPQQQFMMPMQGNPMLQQPFVMMPQVGGDLSFDRLSPQLPPVFEYNDFKYIDTARVEPRIAYSPEKTPPKTPETPHFGHNPFPRPYDESGLVNQQLWQNQQQIQAAPLIQNGSSHDHHHQQRFEMKPIATSETKQEQRRTSRSNNFELENLDGSPGNTLRDRRRNEDLHSPTSPTLEVVEVLQESPSASRNRRKASEQQQKSGNPNTITNGRGTTSMAGSRSSELGDRPASPDRPSSRASGVEIIITGRTRSRTDLCPEVPRSKFEHSV